MKRMLSGFQSTWKILAFWFQNNEDMKLAIIISLLYGPYHFKEVSSYDYANQIKCFRACATLPLKVFPFHLTWLWYLTVLDITCRSSWSWEGKRKLTTIKYHSVFWLQLEFQWLVCKEIEVENIQIAELLQRKTVYISCVSFSWGWPAGLIPRNYDWTPLKLFFSYLRFDSYSPVSPVTWLMKIDVLMLESVVAVVF
jgi:hypothetical protein